MLAGAGPPRALAPAARFARSVADHRGSPLARAGDGVAARQLLERMGPAGTPEGTIAAARVHLLLGDLEAATAVRAHATPAVHVRGRVTTAVLDALLATAAGHEHRATDHLENALATAAPWTLRRPFLAEAAPLRPLLERRIETGTAVPGFRARTARTDIRRVRGRHEARRTFIDPLTERERTVLRYLASTLSNAEIAAELYVSVTTVKTHQRAVYRKLGATGRRDAVRRARLLHQL